MPQHDGADFDLLGDHPVDERGQPIQITPGRPPRRTRLPPIEVITDTPPPVRRGDAGPRAADRRPARRRSPLLGRVRLRTLSDGPTEG